MTSTSPLLTLSQRLADLPPQRTAIIQGERRLTFGALRPASPGTVPTVAVVSMADVFQGVSSLVAMDGGARVICLASPSLPQYQAISGEGAGPATRWVLATSGTTGTPKLVGHTLASLTRTIKINTVQGEETRWGLLYDPARFAGLQVVLHALLNGATLLVPHGHLPLSAQLAELAAAGCSHLSATPTLWRKILMTPGWQKLPLQQVTLGGEIADQAILDALTCAFPGARITHVFASTEAGVGFSVADGKEGFPAHYLHDPPHGISLQVVEGRLWVANPLVAPNYLTGHGTFVNGAGFIDTGDQVVVQGERVLFCGRQGGVINVGGHKIYPETVERVVNSHPDVALCRVGRRKSPFIGALVTLEVVPRLATTDPAILESAVRAWCLARLERHAVPVTVTIVPTIATNSVGKVERGSPS